MLSAAVASALLATPTRARGDELVAPRLIDRAAAPLLPAYFVAGVSHRGEAVFAGELRLGALAAVGLGYDDRLLVGATARPASSAGHALMWFRVGLEADRWFRGQPATDLTLERFGGGPRAAAAELRVTATDRWSSPLAGAFSASLGLGLWELADASGAPSRLPLRSRLRPFAGAAWSPSTYPRTSLLLEGSFGPSLLAGGPRLDWRLGWGARYRAFSWGLIDLVVRNRQDGGLAGSTVMVRVTAEVR
jgi:hypothetical protein